MERLAADGKMKNLDFSQNATFDGTISGTVDVAGKYGRARTFDGVDDNIVAGGTVVTAVPITAMAWVKGDSTQTSTSGIVMGNIMNTSATGGWRFMWDKTNTRIVVQYHDGVALRTVNGTSGSIPAGTYAHVAVLLVANGGNTDVSVYINGVLNSGPTTATGQPAAGNAINWRLGMDNAANQFKGDVDAPYVYGRALGVSEILDAMNASAWDLLQNNVEVRFRETGAPKEWFRGRIRDRVADEVANEAKIGVVDNAVIMADAKWLDRRTFPQVPAGVTMDEIMNSPEGEPKNGQVLRWDMESLTDAGDMRDLSGNANNGTITGAASVNGKWGLARNFDVSTENVSAADSASLSITGAFTVAAWVRVGTEGSDVSVAIFRKHTGELSGGTGYAVGLRHLIPTGDRQLLARTDGTATNGNTFNVAVGTKFHIAVTKAAGSATPVFYVNGAVVGGGVALGDPTDNAMAGQTGAAFPNVGVGIPFGGSQDIDEVQVYNRALSATEIGVLAGVAILQGGVGTVDSFTAVGFRSEDEQRLYLVDALARAVAGEWFVDRDANDKDRMNLVSRIGSASPTDSFRFGQTAVLQDRKYDTETVVNDWVAIGNDATKQLKSRNFQATTLRTTLSADLTAVGTTATVVSTTGFPTTGNLFIGAERVNYTGTTATTFTGLTRAYTADGYPSLAAYAHNSGIEVWLHSDNDATPDSYYTPFTPQNGSSVKAWGLRSGTYTDQFYNDQNALDRLAQRLSGKFKDPRESVIVQVYEETIVADIGDAVTLLDENGAAFFNSPYRVFTIEYDHSNATWILELGNYRDTFDRRVAEVRDDAGDAMYYAASAATTGVASYSATNVTLTTTTETTIITATGLGIRAGQKVAVRTRAQLTTGTLTATVTPRVRRGTGTGGALVGEANAITNPTAAGGTDEYRKDVTDTAQNDDPIYTFSLQQGSATGNGTALESYIEITPVG